MENSNELFLKCNIKQTKWGGLAFHFTYKSVQIIRRLPTRWPVRRPVDSDQRKYQRVHVWMHQTARKRGNVMETEAARPAFPVAAPQTRGVPNEPTLKWMSVVNLLHSWQKRCDQRDLDVMNEADNGRSGARTGRANGNRCQKQRFLELIYWSSRCKKTTKTWLKQTTVNQSVSQTIQK